MKQPVTLEGNHQPPSIPKFLLYLLLTHDELADVLGDLEEDFNRAIREFGIRRARTYYTVQALTSVAWLTLYRIERSRLARTLLVILLLLLGSSLGLLSFEQIRTFVVELFR